MFRVRRCEPERTLKKPLIICDYLLLCSFCFIWLRFVRNIEAVRQASEHPKTRSAAAMFPEKAVFPNVTAASPMMLKAIAKTVNFVPSIPEVSAFSSVTWIAVGVIFIASLICPKVFSIS